MRLPILLLYLFCMNWHSTTRDRGGNDTRLDARLTQVGQQDTRRHHRQEHSRSHVQNAASSHIQNMQVSTLGNDIYHHTRNITLSLCLYNTSELNLLQNL